MELYAKIDENGNMVDNPYFGDNLRDALGIEPKDHPNYLPFVRITFEETGLRLKLLEKAVSSHQKVNGVWTDVWSIEPLQGEELQLKMADIDQSLKHFKEVSLVNCDEIISSLSNQEEIQIYENYKQKIRNFSINNYDVYEIVWPTIAD